jgi:uncharacterized protein (DUF952 family)/GNAT superfamily N-acetyltransferase
VSAVLLHLTTGLEWRAALTAGSIVAEPFLHLSDVAQVALPANRLFAGRTDMLLLVIDPDRLDAEVRWEPGVPTDPESMRFPHLYGPLPVAAVTSVVPCRPRPDGAYAEPAGLPDGPEARARWFDRGLAQRRAAMLAPGPGGLLVRDPRVSWSHDHNSLWLDADDSDVGADVDAAAIVATDVPRVVSDRPLPSALPWAGKELRLLLHDGRSLPSSGAGVVAVTREVMAGLWGPSWRRDIPGISEEAVEHLIRREGIADAHVAVTELAVLGPDGVPVAATQLRIDGATAAVESVMTDPAVRGRGHATAVVVEAIRRARAFGCDVVFLCADADDWPRRWYERLGFVDIGPRWEATRP